MTETEMLKKQLQEALRELEGVKQQNELLEQKLSIKDKASMPMIPVFAPVLQQLSLDEGEIDAHSPNEAKVRLFLDLFYGRQDVYATRWSGKDGKAGYSPACSHEWDKVKCGKLKKIKCGDCAQQNFVPYDAKAIELHMRGKKVVGVYPLLQDETCRFLG